MYITSYIETIAGVLENRNREVVYFRCHDLFGDKETAKQAARALNRHLKITGGRLGGFHITKNGNNRLKHGIMWKATKLAPMNKIMFASLG